MTSHQWWKNGDHPDDNSWVVRPPHEASFLSEGEVVWRYVHPVYPSTDLCPDCSASWDVHGWIAQDEDGLVVHPGDYVHGEPGGYSTSRENPLADPLP